MKARLGKMCHVPCAAAVGGVKSLVGGVVRGVGAHVEEDRPAWVAVVDDGVKAGAPGPGLDGREHGQQRYE